MRLTSCWPMGWLFVVIVVMVVLEVRKKEREKIVRFHEMKY